MPLKVLRHPKGYEIAVTSWKNDYDNVKTEYYNTSNKEHAIAVVKFCKLFKKSEWEGGIANTYDPNSFIVAKIREVIVDFYYQVQRESVMKTCDGCGCQVKLRPDYGYCNRCAEKIERGWDLG